MNGFCVSGNSNTIDSTIKSLRAWALSSQWILDMDEWKECFGSGRNNNKLALKYSRTHFKNMFPEYYKDARYHSYISKEKQKEMFNIFYEEKYEDTCAEEFEDDMTGA